MENAKLVEDALKALETFDKAAIRYGRALWAGKAPAPQTRVARLYRAAKINLQRKIVSLQE